RAIRRSITGRWWPAWTHAGTAPAEVPISLAAKKRPRQPPRPFLFDPHLRRRATPTYAGERPRLTQANDDGPQNGGGLAPTCTGCANVPDEAAIWNSTAALVPSATAMSGCPSWFRSAMTTLSG